MTCRALFPVVAALLLAACGPSEGDQAKADLSLASALNARTGVGARTAPDAVIDGRTWHALGQNAWSVTPDGKSAVTVVPAAEFRVMIGDETPVPRGHQSSDIIINLSPKGSELSQLNLSSTQSIAPLAGLRRTVDPAYPETSGETLWLPAPYRGVIKCRPRAVEQMAACQVSLERGATSQSFTIAAADLPQWKLRVDGFAALMDRAAGEA